MEYVRFGNTGMKVSKDLSWDHDLWPTDRPLALGFE